MNNQNLFYSLNVIAFFVAHAVSDKSNKHSWED